MPMPLPLPLPLPLPVDSTLQQQRQQLSLPPPSPQLLHAAGMLQPPGTLLQPNLLSHAFLPHKQQDVHVASSQDFATFHDHYLAITCEVLHWCLVTQAAVAQAQGHAQAQAQGHRHAALTEAEIFLENAVTMVNCGVKMARDGRDWRHGLVVLGQVAVNALACVLSAQVRGGGV